MVAALQGEPKIEFRSIHRVFGETHAVNGVSFTVHAGEVFGYIGPNGAGKTTSMRILATLDEPTWGDALVDGFSVVEDPELVRRRLGFMPDYYGAYRNVDVREYLDFFARAHGLRGDERRRAISFAMDFTGLNPLARKPVDGLSKGMKQRLCLGRTMIHDPAVLVLDEPAAGLDPRARIELREMITRLAGMGKAVLVSSHILTELAEMCSRVAIIEQGRLLAVGTVDAISNQVETTSQVKLRVLGGAGGVRAWLTEHEQVEDLALNGDRLVFRHGGGEEAQADLLAKLVQAGFRIAEFSCRSKSLEDVFLEVTRGRVQ